MKYETYRVKAEACPFYFKVATTDDLTEIYLVRSNPDGVVLGSMQIYNSKPLPRASSVALCVGFIGMLSRSVFDLKIESDVSSTNEVPVSKKIVVGAKLSERKAICTKKRRANTTKRKAVK